MKNILQIIILSLIIITNTSAEKRDIELKNLFKELKISQNSKAIEIENKIWEIWMTHPSEDRRGYRLTELLAQGSSLINNRDFDKAYGILSQIILEDPKWAEASIKLGTISDPST